MASSRGRMLLKTIGRPRNKKTSRCLSVQDESRKKKEKALYVLRWGKKRQEQQPDKCAWMVRNGAKSGRAERGRQNGWSGKRLLL